MPLSEKNIQNLHSAFAKRQAVRRFSNALRLVNGAGDGLDGLMIEQYENHFVVQVFSDFWLKEAQALKEFLQQSFQVDYLIIKDRIGSKSSNPDDIKSHVLVEETSSKRIVVENNLSFEVDLNDNLNTGLFLDMRANRLLMAQSCKDHRVLNCFSYTCSFGVYARAFGAQEVINVDVSKKILEKGARNYELNKIEPSKSEFIRASAIEYLEKAHKKNNLFDTIIIDPPSFARFDNKVFRVEKDLGDLLGLALSVLKAQGNIFVSTNLSSQTHNKLEQYLRDACGKRKFATITRLGQDKDFVGSNLVKESYLAAIWAQGFINNQEKESRSRVRQSSRQTKLHYPLDLITKR
jgi:23S rRNA (cytosine1962-C5)-methyltransferase